LHLVLAAVAGAAVAAVGALLLGEYVFTGVPIFGGALLLGLFVGEAVVSVGGRRGTPSGAISAILAAAGLTWGAWISSGHVLGELPGQGWVVVVLGTIAAAVMGGWPGRAADTRPGPSGTG
jgi:hypothetical protein